MLAIFIDTLIDTLKAVPILFIIYFVIELLEYRYGKRVWEKIQKAGSAGPAIGSVAGSIPQCGFSVISSALYSQKLITIGTLLAVYLATSDEAIPIILSQPSKIKIIIPLILTKVVIAIVGGYFIDFIFRKSNKKILKHISAYASGKDKGHHHEIDEKACCSHTISKKPQIKELITHPLIHTLKIGAFIFIISFLINLAFDKIGTDGLSKLLLGHSIFQPVIVALIGLIPTCAASVALAELFLKGVISYGSLIAGLCCGAGLGWLVLYKENKSTKDTLRVIGLLLLIAVSVGMLIQYFHG
jgi:hypothetical protein